MRWHLWAALVISQWTRSLDPLCLSLHLRQNILLVVGLRTVFRSHYSAMGQRVPTSFLHMQRLPRGLLDSP